MPKLLVGGAGAKKAALGLWNGKPRMGVLLAAAGTSWETRYPASWVFLGIAGEFVSSGSQGLRVAHA